MRRELIAVALIALTALAVRVYPAWTGVLGGSEANFLENDAWYHVRLVENQVRNYPFRVTLDPYAAPGGQFVPIPPLFDFVTATAVMLIHGADASPGAIGRLAAWLPPVYGMLAVIALWGLGRRVFGPVAGLVGALLLAVLPGHFLDRTMLGFVDHHALESLLIVGLLWSLTAAVSNGPVGLRRPALVGLLLGLYLLTWSGGALMLAVLALWLIGMALLAREAADVRGPGTVACGAAVVALVAVIAFQDPRMHRFESQLLGLAGLGALGATLVGLSRIPSERRPLLVVAAGVLGLLVAIAALAAVSPDTLRTVLVDVGRLAPDPSRRGVLEARPLFYYAGPLDWSQPWSFFRGGFYIGLIGVVAFVPRLCRARRPADWLVWLFTVSMFVVTLGQNRFGYYLVPACALAGGWLVSGLLAWGQVLTREAPGGRVRRLFATAGAVLLLASAVAPTHLMRPRAGLLPPFWQATMRWLADHTPPAFGAFGDDYYVARYPHDSVPRPDFSIMTWWDQGYWVMARARRVPVANPTQARAAIAARFFTETDESQALAILAEDRATVVVSDWELPFRYENDRIMGRFQSVVDWSGKPHGQYYEVVYRRAGRVWEPVWAFHPAYYRSMAFRLTVLGAAAAEASHGTTVLTLNERIDSGGRPFQEIVSQRTYASYTAAAEVAAAAGTGRTIVVGLDPWRTAFPVEALRSFALAYEARTPGQRAGESSWIKVFRVREGR